MTGPLKLLFDRLVPTFEYVDSGRPAARQRGKAAVIVIASAAPFPLNLLPSQSRGTIRSVKTVMLAEGYRILHMVNVPRSTQFDKRRERMLRRARRIGNSLSQLLELDIQKDPVYQSIMTIRERFLSTLQRQSVDCVPLLLDGFLFKEVGHLLSQQENYDWRHRSRRYVGEGYIFNTHSEIEQEPDPLKRELCHRIIEFCPIVLTWPAYENRYFMTPPKFIETTSRTTEPDVLQTVSTIHTPKGDLTAVTSQNDYTVWAEKYPAESLEDIEKICSIPWERPEQLETPRHTALPDDFEERYVLSVRISSPFVCVAGMMPYQMFLELCATQLDFLKELAEECKERIMHHLDILLEARNIDIVWMGGCEWITPPMASTDLYRELVQGYEREIIDRIHSGGALSHIHCHGNVNSTLELIIDRGADFTEPVEPPPDGDITFAEAKKLAAGRITLGGNIEASLLKNGSAEEVERATLQAFEVDRTRMVLMPTANPIDRFTSNMARNYHKLIDIWEANSKL